jgi:hypothetical protein
MEKVMYEQEKDINFIQKAQTELNKKPFSKFLVLGGFAAAAFNGLIHQFLVTSIIQDVGGLTGTFVAYNTLKNHQSVSTMSETELNKHITKSAFLALGSIGLGIAVNLLPSGLSHIAHYPTSIGTVAGIVSLAEGIVHKMKK